MATAYACSIFISAALLFCVQPMVAKMLLPLLGGSPAVWTTCMVFFQVTLLAGYAYAHGTLRWLGARRQIALHVVVLMLPLLVLPIQIGEADVASFPPTQSPVLHVLGLLAVTVGLPFLVLSTSAPILQRWFAATGDAKHRDPYVLYAASNLGSMIALLSYPAVIDPWLGLAAQSRAWRWGYVAFVVMAMGCAALRLRAPRSRPAATEPSPLDPVAPELTVARRALWVALSAVPSSLLVGVTTYLGTDIAPFPLLWVIPLALYLLTFVLVFAERRALSTRLASRLLPLPVAGVFIVLLSEAAAPTWALLALHLGLFFLAAMVCHGRLAEDRPPVTHLTEFYLWMSVGGVIGGAFNALVAPVVFDRVVEYPLAILLACLMRPTPEGPGRAPQRASRDVGHALAMGALTAAAVLLILALKMEPGRTSFGLMFGVPILVNYRTLMQPRRFALGLTAILVASSLYPGALGQTIYRTRSFFGTVRVTRDLSGRFRQIVHGSTVHGRQAVDPTRRREPVTYYARSGPLGEIFRLAAGLTPESRVAVIGLGCGVIAAYATPGQAWTFYEIDPAVLRIARDGRFFTYLADAFPGDAGLRVELGDARLRLREAKDSALDLLILDAFSSDAIPVHLLAREALALYLQKLAPDGLLALHISNRYLDIQPVVASLARSAGIAAYCREDLTVLPEHEVTGKSSSTWCALARAEARLGPLTTSPAWHRARDDGAPVWTDDRSSILGILRWREPLPPER